MRHWADSFSLPKAHASLFDHLVGEREHVRRHGKAERPGSLEIDDQLDLGGGLLNWQITGLFTFENAGGVDPGQTVSVGQVAICPNTRSSRVLAKTSVSPHIWLTR